MTEKARPQRINDAGIVFDELLVMRVQSGDRQASERLYVRWNTRLLRAARRFTGSDDAAQDLAQECWLAIWKGLGRLRDPAKFRSYAFAILHRRGADHVRGLVREREVATDNDNLADNHPPAQSDSAAIAQAFAGLPPDQRLAAHLHFVEGLTLSEIAEVQSIPEGTAKSRLFHARRKLKSALNPNSQGE